MLGTENHADMTCLTGATLQVVSDQIRLWQADMQRVSHQKAVLYEAFPSQQIYKLAVNYAEQHGWLLHIRRCESISSLSSDVLAAV